MLICVENVLNIFLTNKRMNGSNYSKTYIGILLLFSGSNNTQAYT
jgi:hypothetical protein